MLLVVVVIIVVNVVKVSILNGNFFMIIFFFLLNVYNFYEFLKNVILKFIYLFFKVIYYIF